MSKNPFFNLALNKASRLLGKKARILSLLAQLGQKVTKVKWKEIRAADLQEKLFVFGRLLKAYTLGRYREIPWKTLLLITAVIIYFINPVDLLPDWLPILGFSDDFSVLMAVYKALNSEIDKFLTWEKSQVIEQ